MVGSIVAGILDARVITMVSDCRNIRSELYEMWADDARVLAFRIGPDIIPAECFSGTIDNMRAAIPGPSRLRLIVLPRPRALCWTKCSRRMRKAFAGSLGRRSSSVWHLREMIHLS